MAQKPQQTKRVLCIMDMSCVGRAGLAASLPVLSACGVQACCLPPALFSSHTGGFGEVQRLETAAFCGAALSHYLREGISFDAILTGYLYTPRQFKLAQMAMAQYPNALHMVDPAMGDGGKAYGGFGPSEIEAMCLLAGGADIIIPNYTESALLMEEDPAAQTGTDIYERLSRLALGTRGGTKKPRRVLVTSVPAPGGFASWGHDENGDIFTIASKRVPQNYPGAGDLLSAAILGLTLRHSLPFKRAAELAGHFVEAAAAATFAANTPPREGLLFEPLLGLLTAQDAGGGKK